MSTTSEPITITLPRRLLEHPEAVHIRRMRAAIWLYLVLLARLSADTDTIEVDPAALARSMGLPEGMIRSWIGHLRKSGYVRVKRLNGVIRITVIERGRDERVTASRDAAPRFFTLRKLKEALHSRGSDDALEDALAHHPDAAIQRALAGALAVPQEKIKRSRTALFLYLLKHDRHEKTN